MDWPALVADLQAECRARMSSTTRQLLRLTCRAELVLVKARTLRKCFLEEATRGELSNVPLIRVRALGFAADSESRAEFLCAMMEHARGGAYAKHMASLVLACVSSCCPVTAGRVQSNAKRPVLTCRFHQHGGSNLSREHCHRALQKCTGDGKRACWTCRPLKPIFRHHQRELVCVDHISTGALIDELRADHS